VFRIAVVVSLAFLALNVAKREQLVQRASLLGGCAPVQVSAPAAAGDHWRACRAGRLTGAPDLSPRCTSAGTTASAHLWRCPATAYAAP
jgi:hypothetical protein